MYLKLFDNSHIAVGIVIHVLISEAKNSPILQRCDFVIIYFFFFSVSFRKEILLVSSFGSILANVVFKFKIWFTLWIPGKNRRRKTVKKRRYLWNTSVRQNRFFDTIHTGINSRDLKFLPNNWMHLLIKYFSPWSSINRCFRFFFFFSCFLKDVSKNIFH